MGKTQPLYTKETCGYLVKHIGVFLFVGSTPYSCVELSFESSYRGFVIHEFYSYFIIFVTYVFILNRSVNYLDTYTFLLGYKKACKNSF